MKAKRVCSVIRTKPLNTFSSNAALPDLYGQSSKLLPACTLRPVLPNVFGNWLHGIDLKFRTLIRVGAIAVI
jgi:hypothetical protein